MTDIDLSAKTEAVQTQADFLMFARICSRAQYLRTGNHAHHRLACELTGGKIRR